MNTNTLRIAAALAILSISTVGAQARQTHHRHHPVPAQRVIRDAVPVYANAAATQLSARRHHGYHRGGGHGLICGWTAMQHTGETNPKYARALAWLDKPRTTAHPGAVVVSYRSGQDSAGNQGGHVAVIQSVIDSCTAVVSDEKGTYTRNICRNQAGIVEASSSANYASAEPRHQRRGRYDQRFASNDVYPDLQAVH